MATPIEIIRRESLDLDGVTLLSDDQIRGLIAEHSRDDKVDLLEVSIHYTQMLQAYHASDPVLHAAYSERIEQMRYAQSKAYGASYVIDSSTSGDITPLTGPVGPMGRSVWYQYRVAARLPSTVTSGAQADGGRLTRASRGWSLDPPSVVQPGMFIWAQQLGLDSDGTITYGAIGQWSGPTGLRGMQGEMGSASTVPGPTGATGPAGQDGQDGQNGRSVYYQYMNARSQPRRPTSGASLDNGIIAFSSPGWTLLSERIEIPSTTLPYTYVQELGLESDGTISYGGLFQIRGAQGEQGIQGPQGERGTPGEPGGAGNSMGDLWATSQNFGTTAQTTNWRPQFTIAPTAPSGVRLKTGDSSTLMIPAHRPSEEVNGIWVLCRQIHTDTVISEAELQWGVVDNDTQSGHTRYNLKVSGSQYMRAEVKYATSSLEKELTIFGSFSGLTHNNYRFEIYAGVVKGKEGPVGAAGSDGADGQTGPPGEKGDKGDPPEVGDVKGDLVGRTANFSGRLTNTNITWSYAAPDPAPVDIASLERWKLEITSGQFSQGHFGYLVVAEDAGGDIYGSAFIGLNALTSATGDTYYIHRVGAQIINLVITPRNSDGKRIFTVQVSGTWPQSRVSIYQAVVKGGKGDQGEIGPPGEAGPVTHGSTIGEEIANCSITVRATPGNQSRSQPLTRGDWQRVNAGADYVRAYPLGGIEFQPAAIRRTDSVIGVLFEVYKGSALHGFMQWFFRADVNSSVVVENGNVALIFETVTITRGTPSGTGIKRTLIQLSDAAFVSADVDAHVTYTVRAKEILAGNVGEQGPQGEQGIQGIQGPQGEKGDKGDPGAGGITPTMILDDTHPSGELGDVNAGGVSNLVYRTYQQMEGGKIHIDSTLASLAINQTVPDGFTCEVVFLVDHPSSPSWIDGSLGVSITGVDASRGAKAGDRFTFDGVGRNQLRVIPHLAHQDAPAVGSRSLRRTSVGANTWRDTRATDLLYIVDVVAVSTHTSITDNISTGVDVHFPITIPAVWVSGSWRIFGADSSNPGNIQNPPQARQRTPAPAILAVRVRKSSNHIEVSSLARDGGTASERTFAGTIHGVQAIGI